MGELRVEPVAEPGTPAARSRVGSPAETALLKMGPGVFSRADCSRPFPGPGSRPEEVDVLPLRPILRLPALAVALLTVLPAALTAPARAGTCEPAWITGEPVPGIARPDLYDMVVFDDGSGPALYIGGSFSIAGTLQVESLVRWDGDGFHSIGGTNSGIGDLSTVRALAVYQGRLVVGGSFGSVAGVPAFDLAAWDGTSWTALGSGTNGDVYALFVHEDRLIATGSFTAVGGVAAANIAAWDGSAWAPLGGGFTGSSAHGRCLGEFEGDLVAGGRFLNADGDTVNNIALWNGASWSPFAGGLPGRVDALATFDIDGAGPGPARLVAGGGYSATPNLDDLAYWDGSAWQELANGTQNDVHTLVPSGNRLYVGGFFTGVGGPAGNAQHVAFWSADSGWSAMGAGFNEDIGGTEVRALAEFAGAVYAAGNFTYSDQHAMYGIARWDGVKWEALASGMGGPANGVLTILPWGDSAVVGGEFTSVGRGVDANNVALWTPVGWRAMGLGLGDGEYNNTDGGEWVESLILHGGEIYAAWYDYNSTGSKGARISRWEEPLWLPVVETTGANQNILSLCSHGGDLFAAGSFTNIGGFGASRIARWDGAAWSTLGTGLNGSAEAMIGFEGDLLVGGSFTQAGGAPAFRVARWNGASWSDMGAGLVGGETRIYCFALHGGSLYAGGASRVYRWDGVAWTQVFTTNSNIEALASVGDDLYLSGRFTLAGGSANHVARWDGVTVHALGSGFGGDAGGGLGLSGVYALAELADGSVALGSCNLPIANGEVSYGFARIVPCATTAVGGGVAGDGEIRLAGRSGRRGAAFELTLPAVADARLSVFDAAGRLVARWRDAHAPAGVRRLPLEAIAGHARPLPSGVYFARLEVRGPGTPVARTASVVRLR